MGYKNWPMPLIAALTAVVVSLISNVVLTAILVNKTRAIQQAIANYDLNVDQAFKELKALRPPVVAVKSVPLDASDREVLATVAGDLKVYKDYLDGITIIVSKLKDNSERLTKTIESWDKPAKRR